MTTAALPSLEPLHEETVRTEVAHTLPQCSVTTARVLHVINGEYYAGAERVQDLLALRLPDFGFEVGFACIKPDRFPRQRRSQAAPLVNLPMRSRFDLRPVRALSKLIPDENYALVHTHSPRAAMIGSAAAALAGVPWVHHVHSPAAADSTHRWRNWFNAWIERASLRRVDRVITVSASLGSYIRRRGIAPERIAVVPNGVPVQGPLVARPTPCGTWTLGMMALFRPRKGLEVLLETLAELRSRGREVRLRAVGTFETPEYHASVMDLVEHLALQDIIDWRGFQTDIAAELAQMDLFVLPSLFGEGLPMVVLEAMAAGVPVVGTRVEGIPEAIRDDVDGLLAVPGDAIDLSQVIGRVLDGAPDWHALRTSAHDRQRQLYSDRSMAQGVAEAYRRVLENAD
jgi:glycosyltransferase involved in cell wall biosynthesis